MNDLVFASLRASAKAAGTSVKRLIQGMSQPEFRIAFPHIDTRNEKLDKLKAGALYDSFKEDHFRRLYLGGKIESTGPGEAGRRAKIDAEVKEQHGKDGVSRAELGRRAEQQFQAKRATTKAITFGARYGTITPEPRTAFEEIVPNTVQKLADRIMREEAVAFDREIMTACYGKTGYALAGTCTGRMSGTEPNIGQLPKADPLKDMYEHLRKVMLDVARLDATPPRIVISKAQADELKRYCVHDVETTSGIHDSIYGMPITVLPDLKTLADINVVAATTEDEDMNTAQLRAALAESEAADAKRLAEHERDQYLAGLAELAVQTQRLVNAIRYPSNDRHHFTKVKELKPLATELGAKIVPTNEVNRFLVVVSQ